MASERNILDRLQQRIRGGRTGASELQLGVGDDCAIYRPRAGEDLVFTTDQLIENVHFRRETHRAGDIGYKALARGLSDLAAMVARPCFCLFSLAIPREISSRYIDAIFAGLLELSEATRCPLAGGDLASSSVVSCDVVACGAVARGTALRRSGAKVGDNIWVSGSLGGSALGLSTGRGSAWRKHLRPQPRLRLGAFLCGRASAAMDLSDGLSLDLQRLCRESGVSAEIETPPIFPGASEHQAIHGGEDYELLFTAPGSAKIPKRFSGVPLTPIGAITGGRAGSVRLGGKPLQALGFDHFQSSERERAVKRPREAR